MDQADEIAAVENGEAAKKPKRTSKPKQVFTAPDGRPFLPKSYDSFHRKLLAYWHGAELVDGKLVTVFDPDNPFGPDVLQPSAASPICEKCQLHTLMAEHPFMPYVGPDKPLITIIFDAVAPSEDRSGALVTDGNSKYLANIIERLEPETGVGLKDIRWVPMTRCANRTTHNVNYRIKGNWCRYHAVEDLLFHPPCLIMPVGTAALGLLSHKSNVYDWEAKLLTYRGWPDDWLMKPEFMLPRKHPLVEGKTITGHPIFGPAPVDYRVPMIPIQHPRLVSAARNSLVTERWKRHILDILTAAKKGVRVRTYTRPWYRFINDPDELEAALLDLLDTPGILVSYDTETTGLKPLNATAAIVSIMFRWVDPRTNEPKSLAFPWQFRSQYFDNRIVDHIPRLSLLVAGVLTENRIVCHNAAFDVLYTNGTLPNPYSGDDGSLGHREKDRFLCELANAAEFDTWHMAYCQRQRSGSLGLEVLAYDYAPELAGYEEDMTLLIELKHEQLHPGAGAGGHYLNVEPEYYPTHVIPYILGDAEVTYVCRERLEQKLETCKVYAIPIAAPARLGEFRTFKTPSRAWLYKAIMSPSARTLIKLMGRGMFVDEKVLTQLEGDYPRKLREMREEFKGIDERITAWCAEETAKDPAWELDLENKTHLRRVLFDYLGLSIQRLTKTGRKRFGETKEEWDKRMQDGLMTEQDLYDYAALDKFTLNMLAVHHPQVQPLQQYRQVHKLYTTYVRPLRNLYTADIDKKERKTEQHLCSDGCIHASFLMTGTRGGRLSCRDPNLQQLPNKGDVKRMFVSRFGDRGCMYQADLSQIELRLMAAACGDPTMVQAYYDKTDLHTLTTSRIFRLPYEHFSKEYFKWLQDNKREREAKELELKRRIGKTVNFLTGYGGGAFGLQTTLANNQVYLPIEECENIIDKFFDSYPSLKKFLALYKRFILNNRVAVSLFGRVRILEEANSDDMELQSKALRAGCNHIIQSTASDMMLVALNVVEDLMEEAGVESIVVSTVHDSLLIDCIRDELPVVHDIVNPVLNNFNAVLPAYFGPDYDTSWMIVPFAGDCEVGPSYYDTRKIPENDIDWDKLLA